MKYLFIYFLYVKFSPELFWKFYLRNYADTSRYVSETRRGPGDKDGRGEAGSCLTRSGQETAFPDRRRMASARVAHLPYLISPRCRSRCTWSAPIAHVMWRGQRAVPYARVGPRSGPTITHAGSANRGHGGWRWNHVAPPAPDPMSCPLIAA